MVVFLASVNEPPSIACDIDASYLGGQVHLQGRITSPVEAAGRYSLEIFQTSRSGRSSVAQSGRFQVKANEPGVFGTAKLNIGPGLRLLARFTVAPAGGEKQCVSEREISDE